MKGGSLADALLSGSPSSDGAAPGASRGRHAGGKLLLALTRARKGSTQFPAPSPRSKAAAIGEGAAEKSGAKGKLRLGGARNDGEDAANDVAHALLGVTIPGTTGAPNLRRRTLEGRAAEAAMGQGGEPENNRASGRQQVAFALGGALDEAASGRVAAALPPKTKPQPSAMARPQAEQSASDTKGSGISRDMAHALRATGTFPSVAPADGRGDRAAGMRQSLNTFASGTTGASGNTLELPKERGGVPTASPRKSKPSTGSAAERTEAARLTTSRTPTPASAANARGPSTEAAIDTNSRRASYAQSREERFTKLDPSDGGTDPITPGTQPASAQEPNDTMTSDPVLAAQRVGGRREASGSSTRPSSKSTPDAVAARFDGPSPTAESEAPLELRAAAPATRTHNDWQAIQSRLRVALLPNGGRATLQLALEDGEQLDIQLTVKDGVAALHLRHDGKEHSAGLRQLVSQLVDTLDGLGIETEDVQFDSRTATEQDSPRHFGAGGEASDGESGPAGTGARSRGRRGSQAGSDTLNNNPDRDGDSISSLIHLVV